MFGTSIVGWYEKNKRDLPWRHTKDPYLVWLSEVILQQTRVDQGLPYYYRFAEQYPNVQSLAATSEDEVLKLWQGLGYYSRARNMHATAKEVVNLHKGKFPDSYEGLLKLKGIGPYTAAAIASFAFGLPYPVVDGNVFRILARYFGISTPIDSSLARKEFTKLAAEQLAEFNPSQFNQAIMEFGAIQCKPVSPDCSQCVLMLSCTAFREKTVGSLPAKQKKIKTRNRFFNYIILRLEEGVYLRKRSINDIWASMYDFPLIETSASLSEKEFLEHPELRKIIRGQDIRLSKVSEEVKHVLSHQVIYARFWEMNTDASIAIEFESLAFVNEEDIGNYALPKLIENYLK